MTTKFKCPHCGEQIEVSEALTHQIEEQVLESLKEDHARQLQDAIKTAEENALKKINEKYLQDLNNAKKEANEEKERSNKLLTQLENLNDEIRKLRRKDEERDLEMKRKCGRSSKILKKLCLKLNLKLNKALNNFKGKYWN